MIYHLMVPLAEDVPGANVFRYISFRTAWCMITSLLICYVAFPPFIEWMKARKVAQIIREDGPESHRIGKVGTPTMGGVCILLSVAISTLLWARRDIPFVWITRAVLLVPGEPHRRVARRPRRASVRLPAHGPHALRGRQRVQQPPQQ